MTDETSTSTARSSSTRCAGRAARRVRRLPTKRAGRSKILTPAFLNRSSRAARARGACRAARKLLQHVARRRLPSEPAGRRRRRLLSRAVQARGARTGLRGGSADFYSTALDSASHPSQRAGPSSTTVSRATRARSARAGCAEAPQTSTLWYTWSHGESAECWLAPSVAELRRDEPDVVVRGLQARDSPAKVQQARDELEAGPADTSRSQRRAKVWPQRRRPRGVPVACRAGLCATRATRGRAERVTCLWI